MSDDDTVHEIFDAEIPRVDAVDGPAHGRPFLILKAGDVDPLTVLARVLKAKYDADQQRRMLAAGHAMKGPDGNPAYPIGDRDDLTAAIRAVGRGGADHAKIRRYIARRAAQLGATDQIPDDWAADGSLITKAASMDDDLDELVPDGGVIEASDVVEDAAGLVAPTHEGDPDDPESAAWEAVDAARARAAVQMLTQLKGLVSDMEEREDTEVAVSGDLGDARSSIDLDQVLTALDCALGVLAKFAVDEQVEADDRAQEVAEQAAALGLTKAIEGAVDQITKAGRVLSAANEASLRAAHASLTEVLGRVPTAPQTEEAPVAAVPAEPVAKAADTVTEDVEKAGTGVGAAPTVDPAAEGMQVDGDPEINSDTASGIGSAEAASVLVKASGMDVETLRGMLMKLVRALPDSEVQQAFQSMAGAVNPTGDDPAADAAPADDPAADAAPAPDPAAAPAAPVPADPTTVPAPADDTTPVDDEGNVTKSLTFEALTEVLKAAVVAPMEERQRAAQDEQSERFAKQIADLLAPLQEQQEAIAKRLETVEAQPMPGPMLNGHTPGGDPLALRGQAAAVDGMVGVQKALRDLAQVNPHQAEAAKGVLALGAITEILRGAQQ